MRFTQIIKKSKYNETQPYFPGWLEERFKGYYAQISTVNTLRLKNSIKDVARFLLGSVPLDIELICKDLPVPPQGVSDEKFIFGYDTDEEHIPGQIDVNITLQRYINKYPDHWEIVKKCLSLWRSKGRHAAGYVIGNEPIDEFIPTTQVSGVKVLDFTGPECEGVGAIKYDFLVINSLSDIQGCVKLIQKRHIGKTPDDEIINGIKVSGTRIVPYNDKNYDIWDLPDDKEVFDDLSNCKTETVFQFDSDSARRWLPLFAGTFKTVEDMSIFTALDRPGPLKYLVSNPDHPETKHSMLVEYARRLKGEKKSPDVVSELDTLCAETQGIMVYQESLTKVYQYFTDCTAVEAEEFRRKVGKKKKDQIDKLYASFMEKATTKVGSKSAQAVWDSINTWSSYGFCHSHSFSYSKLAYTCLWLKHYYPLEWWCSVLSFASKDEVNEKFWKYCGNLVLPPDIVLSKSDWEIEGDKIRAPVSMLFGMGEGAHKQLSQGLPYTDLRSFCQAIVNHQKNNTVVKDKDQKDGTVKKVTVWGKNALNIGKINSMIIAGCMDSFFEPNTPEVAKLDAYHNMMKELYTAEGKKYVKSKKKMPQLDALGRYQAKKAILPPYGEDLRVLLIKNGIIPEYIQVDGHYMRIKGNTFDRNGMKEERWDPVVGGERLSIWETEVTEKGLRCGIIAYIEERETFQYANKSKTAVKFQIEVGGQKMELVVWPDDSNKTPEYAKKVQKGAIVAAVIAKSPKRPGFSARDMMVIRDPLGEDVDNKDEEE